MREAAKKCRPFRAAIAAAALAITMGASVVAAQSVQCPGNSCDVSVTVSGDPANPTITVSAQELRMKKGARNPVITWKLIAPKGFEFRTRSIWPHTDAPVGSKGTTTQAEWDDQCTRLNTTGTAVRIRNRNSKPVALDYDVTVFDKSTGKAYTLDPRIINDP